VREPKLSVEGLTCIDIPGVTPVVPGFPLTPTQPEVISMAARMEMVATACGITEKEKLRERTRTPVQAPSRIGVSFITNAV